MLKNRVVKKLLARKISVNVVSYSDLPSFSVNFSLLGFLLSGLLVAALFSWAAWVSLGGIDYHVTRTDNEILRARLYSLASKAKDSLEYLEMSRKTEKQIRKIIGMGDGFYEKDYLKNAGGPDTRDARNFKTMLAKKAEDINEASITEAFSAIKDEARNRITGYGEITWYITNKYNLSLAFPRGWPVSGRITSPFGYRLHPLSFSYEYHSGMDIANEPGTKIISTANGVVRHAGWASGYGLSLVIDHGFGYSTLYGHMSEISVKEGAEVKRGDIVGRMGSTGTSTGPHVHYEVWEQGVPKNPSKYMEYQKNPASSLLSGFENIFGN